MSLLSRHKDTYDDEKRSRLADIVNAIAVTPDATAATQYSIKNNTEQPVFYDIPTRAFIYCDLS